MRLQTVAVLFVLLAAGLAIPPAAAQNQTVYLNIYQQFVEPGGDLEVSTYRNEQPQTVRLESIDPLHEDPRKAPTLSTRTQVIPAVTSNADKSYYWQSHSTIFHNIAAGYYRVTGPNVEEPSFVTVSNARMMARVAGDQGAVMLYDGTTGQTLQGTIRVGNQTHATDGNGFWVGTVVASIDQLAAQTSLGPAAPLQLWNYKLPDTGLVAYPDRPIYRPDQDIKLRGLVLNDEGNGPATGEATLTISRYDRGQAKTVFESTQALDSFGALESAYYLPSDAAIGDYQLTISHGQDDETRSWSKSFKVEEYRLPEYKVEVATPIGDALVNEPWDALVKASRFYGEPIDAGKVTYEITGNQYNPCSPWYGCPVYARNIGGGMAGGVAATDRSFAPYPYPEPVYYQGETNLQPDGTAPISFTPEQAGRYTAFVTVLAPSGEHISESVEFQVLASSVKLDIERPQRILSPGESFTVTVRATNLDGTPSTQPIFIESTRSERLGGEWQSTTTNGTQMPDNGVVVVPLTMPAESGSISMHAQTSDPAGRAVATSTYIYGYGGYQHDLTLRADQPSVAAGEPIIFHASSPSDWPALVVLEGESLLGAQVIQPQSDAPVVFDATPRSRSVQAAILQAQPDNYVQTATATMAITPAKGELNVTITTDWDTYSDGEPTRILITVTDAYGTPVQSMVDARMIDEALLALEPLGSTPMESLRPPVVRGSTVSTYGPIAYATAGGGQGGGGMRPPALLEFAEDRAFATMAPMNGLKDLYDADSGAAKPQVRAFFPETGLWKTGLVTDENGTVRIRALLPDTLTTWHLFATAISMDGQMGEAQTSLVTRREVVADILPPRFVVAGDEAILQATISNHMPIGLDVQGLLEVEGLEILGPSHRTTSLGPGRTGLISYRVAAPEAGTGVVTFYAWSRAAPEDGDALQLSFPIKPHGTPSSRTANGHGDGRATIVIPATASADPTLQVSIQPSVENTMLDSLPYLVQYPYGCVEQTLSSFMPLMAVAQAIDSFGLDAGDIAPELDAQASAGLKRLYNYQHASGAWGWWEYDADNPYTTAYVIYGLATAKQAGFAIDEEVFQDGLAALIEMHGKEDAPSLKAYQAYAISLADPSKATIPDGGTAGAWAMRALVAEAKGQDTIAKQAIVELKKSMRGSHWESDGATWTTHGITSDSMVTSIALRALLAVDPSDADAPDVMKWLIDGRQGSRWHTTKDTAEAILALVAYSDARPASPESSEYTIVINGQSYTRQAPDSAWGEVKPITLDAQPGTYEIELLGLGDAWWSAEAAFFEERNPITAQPGAFDFQRTMVKQDGEPIKQVKVGDIVRVELTIESDEEFRYVRITDPIPAGFEFAEETPCGSYYCGYAGVEKRDDSANYFLESMGTYDYTFSYELRAVWAGDFAWLPTVVEPMYAPERLGHGDGGRIAIAPQPLLVVGRVGVADGILDAQVRGIALQTEPKAEARIDGADWQAVKIIEEGGVWHALFNMTGTTAEVRFTAGSAVAIAQYGFSYVAKQPTYQFTAADEARWAGPIQSDIEIATGSQQIAFAAKFANVPLDTLRPELLGAAAVTKAPKDTPAPLTGFLLAALAMMALAKRKREGA